MSGLNNKKYLDGDGLLKFWDICCANFPHKDGRGATGNWNINAATATNASAANKLNTNAGSATKPIYFGDGIPKQCNDLIDVNISGNAETADEADKWSNARKITLTGGVTGEVDIDGSEDVEIATTVVSTAHTHNQYYDKNTTQSPNTVYAGPSSGTTAGVAIFRKLDVKDLPSHDHGYIISNATSKLKGLTYYTAAGVSETLADGNGWCKPAGIGSDGNSMILRMRWSSGVHGHDIFASPNTYTLWHRNTLNDTNTWRELLDSGNYNTYSPKLDGTGATGTWPIGILGNAATASSADKLTNVHTIWGQRFDGTENVSGNMSGVGSITATGDLILNTSGTGTTPALCFQRGTATDSSTDWKFYVASGDTAGALTVERIAGTESVVKLSCNNTDFTVNNNIVATGNVTATKFIGDLTGVASKVAVGTGSGSTYRAIVVTDGSNGLYTAGTATGKPQYNYSTGDVKAKSFTTDGGSFNGNLAGNASSATTATTATNLANEPVLAASVTDAKQITVTAGEKTSDPFTVPYATTAGTAAKTEKTLTLKTPAETKTFNGSDDVTFEVTAAKLGLTKAVLYLGKSTTAITDGGTEKPTIDNVVVNTLTAGNIVIDSADSREYIWNGSKWEKFGLDGDAAAGNYKPIQTAIDSPSVSGNATTAFIDTISQDANGVITATKRNVDFSGYATTAQLGNYLPLAGGTMTGNISYNHTGTAGNAKGISYKFGGVVAGEIGGYYASGKLNTLYLGWGTSPWLSANSLSVSENALTYKGTNVSLEGHTHSYLPLSGGTMTGSTQVNSSTFPAFVLNHTGSQPESGIRFEMNGANKGYVGYHNSYGTYIWNSTAAKYLCIADDGEAYVRSTSAANKVIHSGNIGQQTVANSNALGGVALSNFMTYYNDTTNGYVAASFNDADKSTMAATKYIEYWDSYGWFNSHWGKVKAHYGFTGDLTGNVTGNVTGSLTGNADTATTATNLAAAPSLAASGNNITVTAGGKTSGAFTVPYATASSYSDYVITRADYSFDSTNLPNSFAQGISCGFVNSNSGFGNFGSVLTMRTYAGGGGALQLYAPYSPTYGGTRLKARFGNYDSNQGNSWTTLKEIAWLGDIPTNVSQLSNDAGYTTATGHTHSYLPLAGGQMTNGARIYPATNSLYIGRSDNAGWVYMSDMCSQSGADYWNIYTNGKAGFANTVTASNFITSSDRRLKTNIHEISSDKLSNSLNLNFVEFDYKNNDNHSAGHVAQEVREVLPEFVHGKETETEHLSVDYTGLHSVQIKALKDKVTTLENENNDLKNRVEKLEALIEKLM